VANTFPAHNCRPKSLGFRCVLYIFLDVAELGLGLAQILLHLPFGFHALVADELASDFLDRALGFVDTAFDLVLVDAHDLLLLVYAGKRPARFPPTCGITPIVNVGQRGGRVCALSHIRPARLGMQDGVVCASEQTLLVTVDIFAS